MTEDEGFGSLDKRFSELCGVDVIDASVVEVGSSKTNCDENPLPKRSIAVAVIGRRHFSRHSSLLAMPNSIDI
jgi:hypothetical protein